MPRPRQEERDRDRPEVESIESMKARVKPSLLAKMVELGLMTRAQAAAEGVDVPPPATGYADTLAPTSAAIGYEAPQVS
jgi:hypothetical protein